MIKTWIPATFALIFVFAFYKYFVPLIASQLPELKTKNKENDATHAT